ncbi:MULTISPECIES: hypothetical protein [Enterococcus]|uniref:hypothetical protein n=1 Tax=Enterococcus TaxID=1350 RepID=UPI000EB30B26|nr:MULTISPECIES: hypothetical protein [Enterococcus]AYJ44396.1 hypothetical protein D8N35_04490 [Enterococcus casseliflavus]MBS5814406.1 hypothetical protein [Enterococcus casseliflavus]MCD4962967.1 hypothetical protein [Enterococcus casseliflavus]MCD4997601.1 hypothetical protein [Enterococcus gallinarum]MDU3373905.1 hypothetical protein [Enterococcus casseliflavus]
MKTSFTQSNQYSEATARKFIVTDVPTQCATSFIETQHEYVDKQRTDNIKGYKLWFVQKGLNPFSVKFEKEPTLPSFLSMVEFDNLQGIEIRNNVYFKADGFKVIK